MIENVSTQLTVFHCFAHCLLPGRAFASLYALLFLEKEAEIGGRDHGMLKIYQIRALIVGQFVSISVIKTTVTPIASMSAVKFPLNILLTIKTIST